MMYKCERYRQLGLADFNQPVGLKMNPENRRVKQATSGMEQFIDSVYQRTLKEVLRGDRAT